MPLKVCSIDSNNICLTRSNDNQEDRQLMLSGYSEAWKSFWECIRSILTALSCGSKQFAPFIQITWQDKTIYLLPQQITDSYNSFQEPLPQFSITAETISEFITTSLITQDTTPLPTQSAPSSSIEQRVPSMSTQAATPTAAQTASTASSSTSDPSSSVQPPNSSSSNPSASSSSSSSSAASIPEPSVSLTPRAFIAQLLRQGNQTSAMFLKMTVPRFTQYDTTILKIEFIYRLMYRLFVWRDPSKSQQILDNGILQAYVSYLKPDTSVSEKDLQPIVERTQSKKPFRDLNFFGELEGILEKHTVGYSIRITNELTTETSSSTGDPSSSVQPQMPEPPNPISSKPTSTSMITSPSSTTPLQSPRQLIDSFEGDWSNRNPADFTAYARSTFDNYTSLEQLEFIGFLTGYTVLPWNFIDIPGITSLDGQRIHLMKGYIKLPIFTEDFLKKIKTDEYVSEGDKTTLVSASGFEDIQEKLLQILSKHRPHIAKQIAEMFKQPSLEPIEPSSQPSVLSTTSTEKSSSTPAPASGSSSLVSSSSPAAPTQTKLLPPPIP